MEDITTRISRLKGRPRLYYQTALEGLKNREIAEKFGVELRTVTNGLNKAYRVLGIIGKGRKANLALTSSEVIPTPNDCNQVTGDMPFSGGLGFVPPNDSKNPLDRERTHGKPRSGLPPPIP